MIHHVGTPCFKSFVLFPSRFSLFIFFQAFGDTVTVISQQNFISKMEGVQPLRHQMKEQARSKTTDYPTATMQFRALPVSGSKFQFNLFE